MKVVSKDKIIKAEMMDQVKHKILIMKKVHHPNVVKLHEVMATKSKIYYDMDRSVYHCDLKPDNLLLDENGNLKVTDFGSYGVILFVLPSGYLPFQSNNIISMYKKIYRADFKFRPWFSLETQMIVNRLLDPNPITRISASELMDITWFKFNKTLPKNVKRMSESKEEEEEEKRREKKGSK
ncbi:hypothetical protein ACSBR1_029907 [Camellia fascicularis]